MEKIKSTTVRQVTVCYILRSRRVQQKDLLHLRRQAFITHITASVGIMLATINLEANIRTLRIVSDSKHITMTTLRMRKHKLAMKMLIYA